MQGPLLLNIYTLIVTFFPLACPALWAVFMLHTFTPVND